LVFRSEIKKKKEKRKRKGKGKGKRKGKRKKKWPEMDVILIRKTAAKTRTFI
jgi:glutathione synthase/RimK-type ligase-like ATP-grasp enzyme